MLLIAVAANNHVKTDKRDSLKLATQLASHQLKGIFVSSPQREAYRELTRLREKLTQDKKRVSNRLKSLLYHQGFIELNDQLTICKQWLYQ